MVQYPGNRLGAASGALVVQADALHLPLPDGSVDLIVTSPPYFALRSYDAGPAQIGSEPTPQAFLEALWQATGEMARVLKLSGSMFVNLGDKYSGYTNGQGKGRDLGRDERGVAMVPDGPVSAPTVYGMPNKSLMLLPERYRIGCVDHLGLIARAVIVWDKPNGLPESVGDRVRRSHEDWVHLTRQPRYYSAIDEVREPQQHLEHGQLGKDARGQKWNGGVPGADSTMHNARPAVRALHPLGKLPGSVWSIPSEPLRLPEWLGVDHYAAFPSEWPRRLILGFSPNGICLACGQGRVPVVDRRHVDVPGGSKQSMGNSFARRDQADDPHLQKAGESWNGRAAVEATILGYGCACTPYTDHPGSGEPGGWGSYDDAGLSGAPAANGKQHVPSNYRPKVGPWREYHLAGWQAPPTRPAVILDPFSGVGTTIGVARQLGRIGIGTDLSHAYCRAARYRVFQSGDFSKAEARTWTDRQGALL